MKLEDPSLFGFGDGVCIPVVEWMDQNILTSVYEDHVLQSGVAPGKGKSAKLAIA